MASHTEENYLKALFSLTNEKETVNISELSNLLKVSLPTANSMVKNLGKQALVNYQKYKPISLTEMGKKMAALVLRKHRLTEMYLVDKMGFGWEEVHEIAEQVEHIDSPIFFERMDELLNFPTVDPHGSPIPDKNGISVRKSYIHLSDCKTGDLVRFEAISHDSSDFLKFLNSRELNLGIIIEIKSIEQFDNSMMVSYLNHASETFSQIICDRLLVETINQE
jgi:DtxR family Mn-dependent transcriptional regulator